MTNIMKKESGRQPATFGSVVDQIFQNNLSRFFDDAFPAFNGKAFSSQVPVNIRETDKSFEMEIVAPGLQKEDFQLNLAGNTLTVSFEHKEENKQENKNEGWIRQEFRQQSFSRSFNIDDAIDTSKIVARYNNGILHLSLPKSEKAQQLSRVIQVS